MSLLNSKKKNPVRLGLATLHNTDCIWGGGDISMCTICKYKECSTGELYG